MGWKRYQRRSVKVNFFFNFFLVSTHKEEKSDEIEELGAKDAPLESPKISKNEEKLSPFEKLIRFSEENNISLEEIRRLVDINLLQKHENIENLKLEISISEPEYAKDISKGDPLMGNHTRITYGNSKSDFLISNFEGYYLFKSNTLIKVHKFNNDYGKKYLIKT